MLTAGVHTFSSYLAATSTFQAPGGSTNITRHDNVAPGICAPLFNWPLKLSFQEWNYITHME